METVKRTLTITASFTGVIPTGAYENEKPMFSITETLENVNGVHTDEWVSGRQKELQTICYGAFQERERESLIKRIEKERKDIRFYHRGEKRYPSVTSIIGWDADYHVSPEDLVQYASQGEINHLKLNYYITKGEWLPAEKIPEAYKHIVILTKGNLKLDIDSGNLPAFLDAYPIKFQTSEQEVFNDEHLYAGRYDATGIPTENKKEWIEAIPTIFDLKRTPDPVKNFKQMAAYAMCCPGVKQMVIIPVNDKTKQGFSKPIVTKDIDSYFKMFLQDRVAFKERFGI